MRGPSNLPPGVTNDDVERQAGWTPVGPHRSADRTCGGCRFWSEMIAQYGGGVDGAMCLNAHSHFFHRYMGAKRSCPQWKSGHLGAIDSPGFDGTEYEGEPDVFDGSFPCEDCNGTGRSGDVRHFPAADMQPPEAEPCRNCGGAGRLAP